MTGAPQKVYPVLIARFRPAMVGRFRPVFFFADHTLIRSVQERVLREIRTLRARWRGVLRKKSIQR